MLLWMLHAQMGAPTEFSGFRKILKHEVEGEPVEGYGGKWVLNMIIFHYRAV